MENRTYERIPPRRSVIALVVPLLIGFCAATAYQYPDIPPLYVPAILFIIGCCGWLIWDCMKSHRLDDSGITIFRLGREVRHIPWNQVEQIGVAKRNDGVKGSSVPFLLIVLKGGEAFDPLMDHGHSFCTRNRAWILTFNPADRYRAVFEKYYGPMDFDVTQYTTRP